MPDRTAGAGRRLLVLAVVLAAAFPFRIRRGVLGLNSFTLFDIVALSSSLVLFARFAYAGRLRIGDRTTFLLLLSPLPASVLSLSWSQDRGATVYNIFLCLEATLAYLLGVTLCAPVPSARIVRYAGTFVLLLMLGSVLSLLSVPGFGPPTHGLAEGTPEYAAFLLSYHTRLSHPFLGLSNNLATVLGFFVFLFAAYGIARGRRGYLFLSAVTFGAVVLTLSRGTVGALVVSGIAFLFLMRRHHPVPLAAVLGALAVVCVMAFGFYRVSESTQLHLVDRLSGNNVENRTLKVRIAAAKIAREPVLGYGGGVAADGEEELKGGVHNAYLEQMLYFGVPLGALVSLGLLALPLRFLLWPGRDPATRMVAVGVAVSLLGQLLTFLSQASFEGGLLRVLFYFSVALSVALLRRLQAEEAMRQDAARPNLTLVTQHG